MTAADLSPVGTRLTDFFDADGGFSGPYHPRSRKLKIIDWLHDGQLALSPRLRQIRNAARRRPPARVLIVGVEVPSRSADVHAVIERLARCSRHDITTSVVPMGDRGKFENIDEAIARAAKPMRDFEWIVVTDDDISFADGFLDDLIELADEADLSLSQPAHAFRSHTTYAITKRRWGSLARQTGFVEIGPLTLIRADAFDVLIPFPPSRYCYGIDLLWPIQIESRGLKMGIVDGTPIRHLRPIAGSYGMNHALEEARAFVREYRITRRRAEFLAPGRIAIKS